MAYIIPFQKNRPHKKLYKGSIDYIFEDDHNSLEIPLTISNREVKQAML